MNKQKLIDHLQQLQKDNRVSKSAIAEIVQSVFDHMAIAIGRKKKFSYPGFGSFVIRKRKKRIGLHPKTKKPIEIATRKTILFRPSVQTKKRINGL
ncbi:MAG: HU family DNA-binding protein [Bdellovibrionota bacterium]